MFNSQICKMSFNGKQIKGVLCDITGVLTESVSAGGSQPIDGSIDALNRLKKAGKNRNQSYSVIGVFFLLTFGMKNIYYLYFISRNTI